MKSQCSNLCEISTHNENALKYERFGKDGAWKHILYGSRNKTSPNLTKKDKLDGFYLEKKKCRVSKWPLILQIFHIKTHQKTLCIYPSYWLSNHFRLILVNLKQNNFGNLRGYLLKTYSVVSTIHSAPIAERGLLRHQISFPSKI
jgi:hypothetical protein